MVGLKARALCFLSFRRESGDSVGLCLGRVGWKGNDMSIRLSGTEGPADAAAALLKCSLSFADLHGPVNRRTILTLDRRPILTPLVSFESLSR